MKRIILSPAQKTALLETLPVLDRETVHRPVLEDLARYYQVPATGVYVMVLHLDTLHALSDEAPLVWKGGTAIQSLLPPDVQRISTDLDFNSTTPHVEILREAIQDINARLTDASALVDIEGVTFGRFYEADHQERYQTIEFRRVLPTPFDEQVELHPHTYPQLEEPIRVQGRLSRVQINYGHHEMPALEPLTLPVRFFPQSRLTPREEVKVPTSSVHDLVADKILATTRHDGFGRERFKDVYDLIALRHLDEADLGKVEEKLSRIGGREKVARYVDGTLETLRILGAEASSVQGFKGSVCKGGKPWLDGWMSEIEETIAWLSPLASQAT